MIHDVGDYLTKLAAYKEGYEPDEPSLSDSRRHVRLNPFEKDVFIFSRVGAYKETFSSSDGDYDEGAHNIGYASLPYNLHQIVEDDTGTDDSTDFGYRKDRSMNFCYDNMPGVVTQRAIEVDIVNGSSSGLGRTRPAPTNPQNLNKCWIYVDQIQESFRGGKFRNVVLNWAIAHEVGHAVGLEHHMGKYDVFNNITYPDAANACAMFTMYGSREGLTKAQIEAATGSGYADTHSGAPADVHNVPIPGDTDSVWENHGERYELHNNHDDQRSYTDQEGE